MKKTILLSLILVLIATICMLTACNNSATPISRAWANNEVIAYDVYDTAIGEVRVKVGEAKFTTTSNLTDADKAISADANAKVTVEGKKTDVCEYKTVFYAKTQTVLCYEKNFTDLKNEKNNYVLKAKHDGKKYSYEITYPNDESKNKSGDLKVGASGYTDEEYIYFYIRCYDLSNVPSSITVADPFSDEVIKLASKVTSTKAAVAVGTDFFGSDTLECTQVAITRTETPIGAPMYAYYYQSETSYGDYSIIKSNKIPVQITENNLTYILKEFSATK